MVDANEIPDFWLNSPTFEKCAEQLKPQLISIIENCTEVWAHDPDLIMPLLNELRHGLHFNLEVLHFLQGTKAVLPDPNAYNGPHYYVMREVGLMRPLEDPFSFLRRHIEDKPEDLCPSVHRPFELRNGFNTRYTLMQHGAHFSKWFYCCSNEERLAVLNTLKDYGLSSQILVHLPVKLWVPAIECGYFLSKTAGTSHIAIDVEAAGFALENLMIKCFKRRFHDEKRYCEEMMDMHLKNLSSSAPLTLLAEFSAHEQQAWYFYGLLVRYAREKWPQEKIPNDIARWTVRMLYQRLTKKCTLQHWRYEASNPEEELFIAMTFPGEYGTDENAEMDIDVGSVEGIYETAEERHQTLKHRMKTLIERM